MSTQSETEFKVSGRIKKYEDPRYFDEDANPPLEWAKNPLARWAVYIIGFIITIPIYFLDDLWLDTRIGWGWAWLFPIMQAGIFAWIWFHRDRYLTRDAKARGNVPEMGND